MIWATLSGLSENTRGSPLGNISEDKTKTGAVSYFRSAPVLCSRSSDCVRFRSYEKYLNGIFFCKRPGSKKVLDMIYRWCLLLFSAFHSNCIYSNRPECRLQWKSFPFIRGMWTAGDSISLCIVYLPEKFLPVFRIFMFSYTGYCQHFFFIMRFDDTHMYQGFIRKYNIRRHLQTHLGQHG